MRRVTFACALLLLACGGSDKKEVEEPSGETEETYAEEEEQGDVLIAQEDMDAVRRIFESKTSIVARCFPRAVEAGELQPSASGFVTLGVTITSARASKIEVLETNLKSQTLEGCVRDYVSSWEFPQMPKPFTTSHIYKFSEL